MSLTKSRDCFFVLLITKRPDGYDIRYGLVIVLIINKFRYEINRALIMALCSTICRESIGVSNGLFYWQARMKEVSNFPSLSTVISHQKLK